MVEDARVASCPHPVKYLTHRRAVSLQIREFSMGYSRPTVSRDVPPLTPVMYGRHVFCPVFFSEFPAVKIGRGYSFNSNPNSHGINDRGKAKVGKTHGLLQHDGNIPD
ncbi:MAG: hypothetical protein M1476_02905 [Candidatus Thermoplasmatota archaeon]|nr:hypothetical protein [Candidatus Thermoplasmatota archaeon]